MTNTQELEELIEKSGLKKIYIAEVLGLSRAGFLKKCKNENVFTSIEIQMLCDLLGIKKLSDKERIFFARKRD